MSELISDVPDVTAARALVALVEMLHTDPLAQPLLAGTTMFSGPNFHLIYGGLRIRLSDPARGGEQLSAARALFGGTVAPGTSHGDGTAVQALTTTWRDLPLTVTVEIAREDEVAELRNQVAGLQAKLGTAVTA